MSDIEIIEKKIIIKFESNGKANGEDIKKWKEIRMAYMYLSQISTH